MLLIRCPVCNVRPQLQAREQITRIRPAAVYDFARANLGDASNLGQPARPGAAALSLSPVGVPHDCMNRRPVDVTHPLNCHGAS